jgi:hypothetical protein
MPSNRGSWPGSRASVGVGSLPAWAWPMSRRTMLKPAGVRKPRFSLSAICQIYMRNKSIGEGSKRQEEGRQLGNGKQTSPRTRESSLVFSKKVTATSPVTTPAPPVSAWRNS